jgi:hypothetical protein
LVGGATAASVLWLLTAPVRTLLPGIVVLGLSLALPVVAILGDLFAGERLRNQRQVPQSWLRKYGRKPRTPCTGSFSDRVL